MIHASLAKGKNVRTICQSVKSTNALSESAELFSYHAQTEDSSDFVNLVLFQKVTMCMVPNLIWASEEGGCFVTQTMQI